MSTKQSDKSHASAWALVILAVPVVYVLTFPIVGILTYKRPTVPYPVEPRWRQAYFAPALWLHDNTPLKEPLEKYLAWWEKRWKPPP